MTHKEIWDIWIKAEKYKPDINKAKAALELGKQRNFNTEGMYRFDCAFDIKGKYHTTRAECNKIWKKDLLENVEYSKKWFEYDNWELVVFQTICTQEQLNSTTLFGDWECVPEHAEDAGFCKRNPNWDSSKWSYGIEDPSNPSNLLLKPFTVRVFYRKDSDYQIAIIFTDEHDTSIIVLDERSD